MTPHEPRPHVPPGVALGRWPVERIVIDAPALLAPAGGARPGERRLVAAATRAGVPIVVSPGDLAVDHVVERLCDGGIAARAGGGPGDAGDPDGAVRVAETPARPSDIRVRWVDASHLAPGHDPAAAVVVATADTPAHRALLRWLSERVGASRAASLLCASLDATAVAGALSRQRVLTKPPGSLGRIEALGAQLAGIAGSDLPPVPHPAAVAVFAGDHGVHAEGVSPWPQDVTAQMVANFLAGGAAINVLARQAGAEVVVVDVGVAGPLGAAPGLIDRKVRPGTADLSRGPAMTADEARRALDVGAEVAMALVAAGARCLVTGDMGIANTTPSAALVAALTGRAAAAVTGRGTGVDDDVLARKTALVAAATARARAAHGDDPLGVLAEVGGLEHAALAGFVVAGVALQVPVVVDGVVAASSLLVASRIAPDVEQGVVAGHRSVEPGAAAVLESLGLRPLLDLDLRLGEGTGAALALPLVEAAARVLREMATFDEAGVLDKADAGPLDSTGAASAPTSLDAS
jgi:nicotinate-nucleotide--dimethylbenzimidazole phosphoribosyltransferase